MKAKTRIHFALTLLLLTLLALTVTAYADEPGPDLGDAPDSTNSFGAIMLAYPWANAQYPTVFDPTTGVPSGPFHRNSPEYNFYLGPDISWEQDADMGADEDGFNNIDPPADGPDRDRYDDGLLLPNPTPPNCEPINLQYFVTVEPPAVGQDVFVNLWFDWDRNGRWGDTPDCPGAVAPEWAVQNQVITLPGAPGMYVFSTPAFLPIFNGIDPMDPLWLRITISEQPAPAPDGRGLAGGYDFGETEDYLYFPEMEGIHGMKWDDLNGNGVKDPGEPGLPGWEIVLTDSAGNQTSTFTDANGNYWFVDLPPDFYEVHEVNQPGWVQTAPPNLIYSVNYQQGGNITGLDFGNWRGDAPGECDLTINKIHEGQVLTYDAMAVFLITVTNVGDGICEGPITVTDTLPQGVSMPPGPFSVGGWNCVADAANPQTITCMHPGPVVPSASLPTIVLNVTLPTVADAGGFGWNGDIMINCAQVDNPNDINPNNNVSCDQATVIAPSPNEWCNTHWDVHIPPDPIMDLTFWMTIHNGEATAQDYDLSLTSTGVTGLGSFTTLPPTLINVPAGGFVNVLITVSPKPVVTTTPVALYSVIVTNMTTGNIFDCSGNMWHPDHDTWFWASNPNDGEPQGIPWGGGGGGNPRSGAFVIDFPIHNMGMNDEKVDIRIDSMGMTHDNLRGGNPISLNGEPAGDSIFMTDVDIPASSTTMIPVSVEFIAEGEGDVILYVDIDQDGEDDSAVSVYVYTVPTPPTAVEALTFSLTDSNQTVLLIAIMSVLGIVSVVLWQRRKDMAV